MDYGCGKFDLGMNFLRENEFIVYGFDPYNRDEYFNSRIKDMKFDFVIVANVLNVIQSDDDLNNTLLDIKNRCKNDSIILFSVFECDRSGIGRITRKGYQRNWKIREYVPILKKYFSIIKTDIALNFSRFIVCKLL